MDLPPYSPDLNPNEELLAKLRALSRKADARTKEALWSTMGALPDSLVREAGIASGTAEMSPLCSNKDVRFGFGLTDL